MKKEFKLTVNFEGESIKMTSSVNGLSIFEKLGIIKYMEMKFEMEALNEINETKNEEKTQKT